MDAPRQCLSCTLAHHDGGERETGMLRKQDAWSAIRSSISTGDCKSLEGGAGHQIVLSHAIVPFGGGGGTATISRLRLLFCALDRHPPLARRSVPARWSKVPGQSNAPESVRTRRRSSLPGHYR